MMEGLGKLASDLLMAGETQGRLRILEEAVAQPPLFGPELRHLEELFLRNRQSRRLRWVDRVDKVGAVARLA
jgi:hypothetical protein